MNINDLEHWLRRSRSSAQPEPPPTLHADIMRAVRRARPERRTGLITRLPRWIMLNVGAVVLMLALVVLLRPRPRAAEPAWESVETALTAVSSVVGQIRTTAPLQDEATKLGEDARTATGFLLSNLPSI